MNLLYGKTCEEVREYRYQINGDGTYFVKERGEVVILFVNGAFASARYPMGGTYSRNGWRILAAIEEEISKIESDLKAEGAQK